MPDRPPTTDPPTPEEHHLIVYWTADDRKWVLAGGWADEAEARQWLKIARHELGPRRVRLLHTAIVAT